MKVINLLTNLAKEPGFKGVLNFYLYLFVLFFFQTSIISQQWIDVTPGEFDHLRGSFINENQGWIAKSGTIYYTEDGAETFETVYNYSFEYLKKIHMVDSLHGYCNVKNNDTSYFLRTTNGGYNWEDITNDPLMVNGPLKWSTGYYFIDKDIGFYGGQNCIYKTDDAGDNWTEMITPQPGVDPLLLGESYNINQINFYNNNYGWAVCSWLIDAGLAMKTTDGGNLWEICEIALGYPDMWDIHYADSLSCGITSYGMGKAVLITEDNFLSLAYVHYDWPQENYTICYQNDSTIWVSGIPAILSRSINSGESFYVYQTIELPGIITPGINDIQFFGNTGFAFGNKFLLKFQDTTIVTNEQNRNLPIGVKVWPVPANDRLEVEFIKSLKGPFDLYIVDALGKKVFQTKIADRNGIHKETIDISSLKKGIYFVELFGDEVVFVKKIIVQ